MAIIRIKTSNNEPRKEKKKHDSSFTDRVEKRSSRVTITRPIRHLSGGKYGCALGRPGIQSFRDIDYVLSDKEMQEHGYEPGKK